MRLVKLIFAVAAIAVFAFASAQFGSADDPRNNHASTARSFEQVFNPPDRVMQLLRKSCFDCHSQQTQWPWYSHLPVFGAEIERDVTQGRLHMNLSAWNSEADPSEQADLVAGMCETTRMRLMPLQKYLILHPLSGLSGDDVEVLCDWSRKAETALLSDP